MNIALLSSWLVTLFTTTADQIGKKSEFIKRKRSFTAAEFVQTLVFGWIENPLASLEDFADELGVSRQAIHDRLTSQCVDMMRGLLEHALRQVVGAQALPPELVRRFNGVFVEDATSISLPASLKDAFPGCGGAKEGQGAAGVKILLRIELITGMIAGLIWGAQKENDQKMSAKLDDMPEGALFLADLGFWCIEKFQTLGARGVWWVSRVPTVINISIGEAASQLLAAFLQAQRGVDRLDQEVRLGAQQFTCRLVAIRCPETVAAERKRCLRLKMRKKGKTPSAQQLVMCEWLVMATNLPAAEYSLENVWTLYRIRWQIELVFKRWKSLLGLDKSNARTHGNRRLTDLYAKLLGCLVVHWGTLLRAGLLSRLSLVKLLKHVRKGLLRIADVLSGDRNDSVLAMVATLARELENLRPRGKRKKKPGLWELLDDPELTILLT